MKTKSIIISIVATILISCASTIAMTRASNSSQTKPDYDMATGFYGGIQNGKLRLFLSEQGGLRFYGLPGGIMYSSDGRNVATLPYKTAIQVKIRSGQIVEVVVLGVGK